MKPKPSEKVRITDEVKALVLKAVSEEGSKSRLGRKLGYMSHTAINHWLSGKTKRMPRKAYERLKIIAKGGVPSCYGQNLGCDWESCEFRTSCKRVLFLWNPKAFS